MALPRSERREVLDRGSARFWTDRGSGQSRISHGAKFWTIEPAVECSHVFERTEQGTRFWTVKNLPGQPRISNGAQFWTIEPAVECSHVFEQTEQRKSGDMNQPIRRLVREVLDREVLDSQESPSEQREVLDEVLDTQPRFWTEPRFWTVKNLQRREVLDQEPARLNE